MGCPLIGNMLTSVTLCGLWSIQIRALLVFQKISFPKARASLLYMSHLRPQNSGRVWRRPRGQSRLSWTRGPDARLSKCRFISQPHHIHAPHRGILASLLLPKADVKAVLEIFETLGPTPRLCIELASEPERLQIYNDQLNDAISDITTGKLEELIKELTMDAVSHKICLISRRDPKVHLS